MCVQSLPGEKASCNTVIKMQSWDAESSAHSRKPCRAFSSSHSAHVELGLQLKVRTALCNNFLCFSIHSNFLSEQWTDRKQELNILLIPEHSQVQFEMQYLKSGCMCAHKWQRRVVFHTFAIILPLCYPWICVHPKHFLHRHCIALFCSLSPIFLLSSWKSNKD